MGPGGRWGGVGSRGGGGGGGGGGGDGGEKRDAAFENGDEEEVDEAQEG